MISPAKFHDALASAGVTFMAGVPDSLLKEFCAYVDAVLPPAQHVITANEGSAVALAAGYYLASGKLPLVYLQNSGFGNTVNPLLSLSDPEVYGLPLIVMIGWRGAPGVKDEPQHVKQGRVTPAMLDAMEIPYRALDGDAGAAQEVAQWACTEATARGGPVVILVHKGAFGKAEKKRPSRSPLPDMLSREAAIAVVTAAIDAESTVVSTTGMISRELYEQRVRNQQDRSSDFLTVGSMGHASQIALGISIALPDANVVCLDGDGALLMHLGGMASIGTTTTGNVLHVVLNNGAHDSVGGQPTAAFDVSLTGLAKACAYDVVEGPLVREGDIRAAVKRLSGLKGHRFLEVRVATGSREDLGRPKETPAENKSLFVAGLAKARGQTRTQGEVA